MDNYWNLQHGAWRDSKPLGRNAEEFLMEIPQWVIYMRKDFRFPCIACADPASQSPNYDLDCTDCFGLGVKVDPLIVPCRLNLGPAKVSARQGDIKQEPGYLEFFAAEIIFPRAVKPELEDLVYVCEWATKTQDLGNVPRPRPLKVTDIYIIKQVNPYFEREISWFGCGMEIFQFNLHTANIMLSELVNIPILNPRLSWPQNSFWSNP